MPLNAQPLSRFVLPGSERKPLVGATVKGPINPKEHMQVTFVLRHNAVADSQVRLERTGKGGLPPVRLTREEFLNQFGARAVDIAAVSEFAAAHHLSVVEESRARRTVILSGAAKDFDEAFDVKLQRYKHPDGAYRGHEGQIMLPDALKDVVQAVLGLDNRPQARPNFR